MRPDALKEQEELQKETWFDVHCAEIYYIVAVISVLIFILMININN